MSPSPPFSWTGICRFQALEIPLFLWSPTIYAESWAWIHCFPPQGNGGKTWREMVALKSVHVWFFLNFWSKLTRKPLFESLLTLFWATLGWTSQSVRLPESLLSHFQVASFVLALCGHLEVTQIASLHVSEELKKVATVLFTKILMPKKVPRGGWSMGCVAFDGFGSFDGFDDVFPPPMTADNSPRKTGIATPGWRFWCFWWFWRFWWFWYGDIPRLDHTHPFSAFKKKGRSFILTGKSFLLMVGLCCLRSIGLVFSTYGWNSVWSFLLMVENWFGPFYLRSPPRLEIRLGLFAYGSPRPGIDFGLLCSQKAGRMFGGQGRSHSPGQTEALDSKHVVIGEIIYGPLSLPPLLGQKTQLGGGVHAWNWCDLSF